MAKYVVPGVPRGAQPSAFMPHWNKYAASGAQSYKAGLVGQPGTQGIAAPTTNTQISPDMGDKAQAGTARSSDAPDVWYPQLYYLPFLSGGYPGAPAPQSPGAAIYSDNLMPVPAVDPRGVAARLSRPVNQRGQAQIAQKRALPRWGGGG
jgi:hypothetical protein